MLVALASSASGVTLDEIRKVEKLTPVRFARFFSDFDYVLHEEIQEPEVFLASRAGDCDDYAILADLVFREKGQHPRLITVRMPGITHVVCYINEFKCYLDFNNRGYLFKTVSCGESLAEIAKKVAHSFDANWTSVSEFTYDRGLKQIVKTVSKVGQDSTSTSTNMPPKRDIVIDF
jgi:hypothetical protein